MWRVLKVALAGFYVWLHPSVSAGEKDNQRLLELIRDAYTLSGGVYSYRRIHGDLREIGEVCSKKPRCQDHEENRLQAIHSYKVPRGIRGRLSLIAPNHVQREFTVVKFNQVYVTDITHIRTWQDWLYLAVVVDLFSRKVIGCSMQPRMTKDIVLNALLRAMWRRNRCWSISDQWLSVHEP